MIIKDKTYTEKNKEKQQQNWSPASSQQSLRAISYSQGFMEE